MATSTMQPPRAMQPAGVSQPEGYRFRYAHNVYFEDGITLTGVLTALLFLTVAGSLDAAGYVPNMGLLMPVTLGAIAMSLLMAYSRFDSFFAFSAISRPTRVAKLTLWTNFSQKMTNF